MIARTTPPARAGITADCRAFLDRPLWRGVVEAAKDSADPFVYYRAKAAAKVLGVGLWPTLWARLVADPLESARWYDVMEACTPDLVGLQLCYRHVDASLANVEALYATAFKEEIVEPDDREGDGRGVRRHLLHDTSAPGEVEVHRAERVQEFRLTSAPRSP